MLGRIALAVVLAAASLPAQGRPRLDITLPPRSALTSEGPAIRVSHVISDDAMQELLKSGFPVQLHYRVELWSSGGLFNAMRRAVEWDVIIRYDALAANFRIARKTGDRITPTAQYPQYADVVAEIERPYKPSITANRQRDRQYYIATVELETLSGNDLDEMERWLKGEAEPAVRGEANPGTALGRGVRKLFARLVGGERRNLQTRSGTFRTE
ncbi:MAG: hypothetical protein U0163_15910 [Gemmatimonadaceae bacterium]